MRSLMGNSHSSKRKKLTLITDGFEELMKVEFPNEDVLYSINQQGKNEIGDEDQLFIKEEKIEVDDSMFEQLVKEFPDEGDFNLTIQQIKKEEDELSKVEQQNDKVRDQIKYEVEDGKQVFVKEEKIDIDYSVPEQLENEFPYEGGSDSTKQQMQRDEEEAVSVRAAAFCSHKEVEDGERESTNSQTNSHQPPDDLEQGQDCPSTSAGNGNNYVDFSMMSEKDSDPELYSEEDIANTSELETENSDDTNGESDHANEEELKTSCKQNELKNVKADESFVCSECDYCTPYSSSLQIHLRTHTGEKPFPCKLCSKTFSRSSSLNRHMKTHTGEKPFPCKLCKKRFSRSSDLNSHIRIHTGEKPFPCTVCKKKFSQSSALNKHLKIHTGEKTFPCKVCTKKFSQSSNLNTHMKTHTGEKSFPCEVCFRKFSRLSHLNSHIKTHTVEKPFPCKLCTETFSRSSSLNTHMKTHTGEKPFPCTVCKKRFLRSSDLNKHIKIHTGEKPFPCKVCTKKFSQSSNLNTHMKTH